MNLVLKICHTVRVWLDFTSGTRDYKTTSVPSEPLQGLFEHFKQPNNDTILLLRNGSLIVWLFCLFSSLVGVMTGLYCIWNIVWPYKVDLYICIAIFKSIKELTNKLVPLCDLHNMIFYLDISVEADSGVIDALQALKCHWTLLLIVDEEDDDPACEVKQHSYCSSFTDATVRPARPHREKSTEEMADLYIK